MPVNMTDVYFDSEQGQLLEAMCTCLQTLVENKT